MRFSGWLKLKTFYRYNSIFRYDTCVELTLFDTPKLGGKFKHKNCLFSSSAEFGCLGGGEWEKGGGSG